ncbi:Splicing factor 3B subunit 1 [Hordeum vulgare]|nr:Splicing factor 3B subunit 1 [Hordeum vulgare]
MRRSPCTPLAASLSRASRRRTAGRARRSLHWPLASAVRPDVAPVASAMAGIVNTEFPELAQTGLNYLSWSSDCEIWFEGKGLLRAIGQEEGPSAPTPAKQQKPEKGEQRPQDCFTCGSLEHFSRQCRAPKEVVAAYKAQKERETHLALVQEQSPLAPPAAPVMIATPPLARPRGDLSCARSGSLGGL